jgi:hypothetical protein
VTHKEYAFTGFNPSNFSQTNSATDFMRIVYKPES